MSTTTVTTVGVVNNFAKLWSDAMSAVLGQIASTPFPIELTSEDGMLAGAAGDVHLTITAAGAARGEMTLRVPGVPALSLVKIFTGTESPGPEPSADDRTALEELFRQIAGHVVTNARHKGLEIQLTTVLGEAPTWSPGGMGWFRSPANARQQIQIEWKLSSALASALTTNWQEPEGAKAMARPAAETVPMREIKSADFPAKLDLLMDVELDVVLRLGGRTILLKEILDLGAGSVVELDRNIQDEADLFLDGRLIARGEVVAVEGNFGVRITEILGSQNVA